MRITGGVARGCPLAGPGGRKMRPTSDKVREALFNMIDVEGALFLDVFGGTGAVGCEAMSRGAAGVTIVESHRHSLPLIRKNVEKVSAMLPETVPARVVGMEALEFVRGAAGEKYHFIFCDPPYDWDGCAELLRLTHENALLARDGTLALEQSSRRPLPAYSKPVRIKKYGDTSLLFYHL